MRFAKLAGLGAALTLGFGLTTFADETDGSLRRIACADLMVFAPANGVSDADTCRAHGGLAAKDARAATSALVILVRNRPAGASVGLDRTAEAGS
ncbi:antitermination protein [Stappia sp.]|uniref:antitermination protein n=1 Tax=Stappia sp. TaxID=1870903 RepID=UPI0032D96E51